jgi:TonB family protein
MTRIKSVPLAFLITLAIPAASAVAQATEPQIAQTSEGACAAQSKPPALDRPDILSTPYIPPKPNPNTVIAPVLVHSVDPQFPSDAPKGPFAGITKVALLVDTDGMPQQVHVEQSLGPDFDKAVIATVQKWRFKPGLQYGKPVPIKICVVIDYRK